METEVEIPEKLAEVFAPAYGEVRYRGARGGRGSGKTVTFAKMTAIFARDLARQGRRGVILCGREFMNSLEESSLEEVKQAIRSEPWLEASFVVGEKYVKTRCGRIRYVFAGLRHNLDSIKSKAKVLLAWIDEAENVSETAWRKLLPTVREEGSEIWLTWNPEKDGSPTDIRFCKNPPARSVIVEVNHDDNPWFPDVLEQERQHDRACLDDATYAHIWEGAYLQNSSAQVFAGKYRVAEFEPGKDWDGPYQGLDWGFAQDPTAGVRCWVHGDVLYIEHEAVKVGLELDHTAQFIGSRIPGFAEYVTRADNARPESISYVRRHGLPKVAACEKGKGSVEDGIAHMRSYREIVIHPRCVETIKEFRLYSYKVDRLSGDVLPDIVDAYNHAIDACIEHGQMVTTKDGLKPVQDVRAGDMVLTRHGFNRVKHAWKSGDDEPIWVVKTKHTELRATANHLVYTVNRGFVRVDALRYNDDVLTEESLLCKSNESKCLGTPGAGILTRDEGQTESILSGRSRVAGVFTCIERFGKSTTEIFRKAGMFITSMGIARTTASPILSVSAQSNTSMNTLRSGMGCLTTLNESGRSRKHGMPAQKGSKNIGKLARLRMRISSLSTRLVTNAGRYFALAKLGIKTSFARTSASQHGAGQAELMMLSGNALYAAERSSPTNTPRPKLVADRVLTVYDTGERNKVYDLEVEGAHEFVASGVLVHNCRYALEPLRRRRKQPTAAFGTWGRIGG